MAQFESPAILLLLLGLPFVWLKRKSTEALPHPAILRFAPVHGGLRLRCSRYLPVLRIVSLALLVIALAHPTIRPQTVREIKEGLAIEIVLDRSASMATTDMKYQGRTVSRLDAVKRVSQDFIFGNSRDLEGRPNDMIGLIAFAADPITLSPLTLSYDSLRASIGNLQVAKTVEDDGTAIGDALALAAARLQVSVGAKTQEVKGKLIVLITDGENNMGERTPEQAAAIAKAWGVRVYAITIRPESVDHWREQQIEYGMAGIAKDTGGLARTATDGDALQAIHREIDRLEPAHIESVKRSDGDRALTAFLLLALVIILGEFALRETWLRKAPE